MNTQYFAKIWQYTNFVEKGVEDLNMKSVATNLNKRKASPVICWCIVVIVGILYKESTV